MRDDKIDIIENPEMDAIEPVKLDPLDKIALALLRLDHSLRSTALTPGTIALSLPADMAKNAIPISCGGQYDAVVSGFGDETEVDFPGGAGPAAVRSTAAADARAEATKDATTQMTALQARMVCESGCTLTPQGNPVITMGRVAITTTNTGWFISYNATVTAKATQTFKCV